MTVFKLNSKIRNNNNRNHNPIICLTSLVLDREIGNTIKKSLIAREENCPPSSFNHARKNLIPILWLHPKKKKKFKLLKLVKSILNPRNYCEHSKSMERIMLGNLDLG